MSQIHYCFIAKDPGMVVFETIVAKDLSSQPSAQRAAFRREISDRLHAIEQQVNNTDASDLEQGFIMRNTGALDSNAKVVTCNNFTKGFLNGDVKLTVLSNTVYIGCVSDAGFSDDKAGRFLDDLRAEFSKMYQGRLSLIKGQTNLTANVYDKPFNQAF